MKIRRDALSPLLWAFAAFVSLAASYLLQDVLMEFQSQLYVRDNYGFLVSPDPVSLGTLELATVLVTALLVPVTVGILFQRLSPRPRLRDSFVITSLAASVLWFFGDLVAMGDIRLNPVPSASSPSILILMGPIEAFQRFLLVALPAGLTTGAMILLGATLLRKPEIGWAPATRTMRGLIRSYLPWLVAGFLSVLPVCAGAVLDDAFRTGLNAYPSYWPLVYSLLPATTAPVAGLLGYVTQDVSVGFSLKRSFLLPTAAALSLYSGFAGIGFGFWFFIPAIFLTPTVLYLMAGLSFPIALTVGGMMFAASRVAVLRAGKVTQSLGPPAE